jgi:hypothetical protein
MGRIGMNNTAWYTASVVLMIETDNFPNDPIPVFENFYLIEAESHEAAAEKATVLGEDEAAANSDITYKDLPARFVFSGIRKIRSVYNPGPLDLNADQPVSGTELSHSYFELKSRSDLEKFAKGESVSVQYVDDDVNGSC